MKQVRCYSAEDGKLFESKDECLKYEGTSLFKKTISEFTYHERFDVDGFLKHVNSDPFLCDSIANVFANKVQVPKHVEEAIDVQQ